MTGPWANIPGRFNIYGTDLGIMWDDGDGGVLTTILAVVGVLVASINVFGGFTVTARMLQMFQREDAVR